MVMAERASRSGGLGTAISAIPGIDGLDICPGIQVLIKTETILSIYEGSCANMNNEQSKLKGKQLAGTDLKSFAALDFWTCSNQLWKKTEIIDEGRI
ncbi:MAG: hypothetical protein HPY61_03410 [Methanotrichaceae archaeon]|nr:hypothetical protein [Methanotrichaceae archaeon]